MPSEDAAADIVTIKSDEYHSWSTVKGLDKHQNGHKLVFRDKKCLAQNVIGIEPMKNKTSTRSGTRCRSIALAACVTANVHMLETIPSGAVLEGRLSGGVFRAELSGTGYRGSDSTQGSAFSLFRSSAIWGQRVPAPCLLISHQVRKALTRCRHLHPGFVSLQKCERDKTCLFLGNHLFRHSFIEAQSKDKCFPD